MGKIPNPRVEFAHTFFAVCLAMSGWLAGSAGPVQAAAKAGVPQPAVPPAGVPGVWVPVLMYHHIGTLRGHWPDSQFYVSSAAFEAQMAYLAEDGFASVSLEQVLLALHGDGSLPAHPVAITFDDGNQDNYDLALPVLEKYYLSATFLIVTGWVGKPGHLTWNEIATMQQAGMHFGAHTVSHPYLPFLSQSNADREIRASKSDLESHLGQAVLVFAYPYGHTSPLITRLVQLAGFGLALGTSPYRLEHTLSERFFLTRYGVYSWTSLRSFERHLPAPARMADY
jgi:peptidoglycan/xylan/chitin deacetylase (PgdA/CDA1 family)